MSKDTVDLNDVQAEHKFSISIDNLLENNVFQDYYLAFSSWILKRILKDNK